MLSCHHQHAIWKLKQEKEEHIRIIQYSFQKLEPFSTHPYSTPILPPLTCLNLLYNTAVWIHITSLLNLPSTEPPSHPSRSSESTLEGWEKSFSISSLSNFCTAPRLEASQNDYHQPLFFCTCCSLSLEYPSLPVDLSWLNQSISLPGEAFPRSFPHHQMLG